MIITLFHQRPQRRGCCVEQVDFVFIHHVPEAAKIWKIGHTFKHDRRGAVGQGPVDNIWMARDPADVCCAPVDIIFVIIKNEFMGIGRVYQITTGGMEHTFGFTCGTGSIQNKQRVFGIHFFRGTFRIGFGHFLLPPDITSRCHIHRFTCAPHNNHMFNGRCLGYCLIGVAFHGDILLGASDARILRNQNLTFWIVNTITQGIGAESAENNRVHGSDAGTGQHGHGQLGYHLHVEADAIALFHSKTFQYIGKFLHLA